MLYGSGMGIGRRIKVRLNELDKTPAWLAVKASTHGKKLSAQALSAIINRDSVRSEFTGQMAEALGVNDHWLASGKGPKLRGAAVVQTGRYSPEAEKLAELFDGLAAGDRRAAWPWLIRMFSPRAAHAGGISPLPRLRPANAGGTA